MAAVINLAMAAYLAWSVSVPSDPSWGWESFSAVLGLVWRIVIASILAEIAKQLADTEVYHRFVTKVTTRAINGRVPASNSGRAFPSTISLFCRRRPARCRSGNSPQFAVAVVWQIFVFNLVVKFVVTLVSLLIYTTRDPDWSQRAESDR